MAVLSTYNFGAGTLDALPGPGWIRELRRAAWDRFAASTLPTESEEIWRYSRIGQLDLGHYAPLPEADGDRELDPGALSPLVNELVRAAGTGSRLLVLDSRGRGVLSGPVPDDGVPDDGVSVLPYGGGPFHLGPTGDTDPGGSSRAASSATIGGPPPEAWVALNSALCPAPWRVKVPAGAHAQAPLVVVHWLEGDRSVVFPRLEIEMGRGSSASVVQIFASPDHELLSIPVTEMSLGAGSRLQLAQVQLLGPRVWQLGNQSSWLDRDAALLSMTVAAGGYYARARNSSVLGGPGGESQLLACYFGSGKQMHDLRTIQHHAAPSSRSALLFKGAVAQEAHSVYSGLIRVEKGAKGTNAFQTNRNLVLSEGAVADSVPNLEIEDNDVRCSHASAVGPIDESQLFYLESRGVPTERAQRLIALGFMDEVLEQFPVAGMRPVLRSVLADKLSEAGFGAGTPSASSGQAEVGE
ncbi:MAG TPA: Fe-S cluster assembly protein SufD [Acidimicrobiales bacterium]|nr:Fe-S cluster assembly protein SufD [Acidimicrobiales bacterium]